MTKAKTELFEAAYDAGVTDGMRVARTGKPRRSFKTVDVEVLGWYNAGYREAIAVMAEKE